MKILEGLFAKTTGKSYSGRIYPESIFHYHLVRKMRSSRRISKIMNLFIK
jgi:hypothetical protein